MLTKQADIFTETRIEDEVVVMLLSTGAFLSLTGTSAAIWERIDGTRDRDSLVAGLAGEYDASDSEIGADVDSFLAQLREAGLIAGD